MRIFSRGNRHQPIFSRAFLSVFLIFVLAFTPVSAVFSIPVSKPASILNPRMLAAPNQVLVKFKSGVSSAAKVRAKKDAGVEKTIKRMGPKGAKDIYLFELESDKAAGQAVAELNRNKAVEIAEPNYRYKSSFTPDDPDFANQWGWHNTGQTIRGTPGLSNADINAPEGWDIEQGFSNPVTVAVIDTGIDLTHPDLAGKLWQNAGETPGNGIDDDGNGYIDDYNGYNFAGISNGWYTPDAEGVREIPTSSYAFAQSIKGTGQPLTTVGIGLYREGTPTVDIDIAIRDNLNGADLATAAISPQDTSITTPNWVIESLSNTVTLTADKTYYIVFSAPAAPPAPPPGPDDPYEGNRYYFFQAYYPDGQDIYREGMEHWKAGSDWLSFPNYDLTFMTNGNGSPHDDNGHGTHVSGIVGAATNNAIGMAGVAPGAKIMPLKAGDSGGGFYVSDVISALYYAADQGADVVNMSLGGPADSKLLDQYALDYAAGKNVVLVAAAGNEGPGAISYPAAYANVIAVSATDNKDEIAGFSNTNEFVDVAAPGVDIYATMPTYPVNLNAEGYAMNYDYLSGTSMASPVVAGAAALLLAKRPSLTPSAIEKILEKGASDLGGAGRDDRFGHGRVDIENSFNSLLLKTKVTVDPPDPDGDNGWYTSYPAVTLKPTLANSTAYYAWDSTAAVTTYTVPFLPPSEGAHTLYYYAVDDANNTETVNSRVFKIDTDSPGDPNSVGSSSHTTGTVSFDNTIDIDFSGATDTVSGVEGYSASWTSGVTGTPPAITNISASVNATTSPPLGDGDWWFNLRTKDNAGNWTSTVHLGPFGIDLKAPTGSISINSGAVYANSTAVNLGLSATDNGGSGVTRMRFKNEGGLWSAWEAYNGSKAWNLNTIGGAKRVYTQFKDAAGNESAIVSDGIFLDSITPTAKVISPPISTDVSKNATFKVAWSGADTSPSSAIESYDVDYKIGADGGWITWQKNTSALAAKFVGTPGKTYYFRAKTKDKAGNISDWSPVKRTLVPYDQNSLISRRDGFSSTFSEPLSGLYLGTVRYSAKAGDSITYKVKGRGVHLISTKGKNRSKAKIYVDGKYIKTIDNYSARISFRKVVFSAAWAKSGTHYLKVVNLGTPARRLFDIDGLAVVK